MNPQAIHRFIVVLLAIAAPIAFGWLMFDRSSFPENAIEPTPMTISAFIVAICPFCAAFLVSPRALIRPMLLRAVMVLRIIFFVFLLAILTGYALRGPGYPALGNYFSIAVIMLYPAWKAVREIQLYGQRVLNE